MKSWIDRFWSKVDIRGEDQCWQWMGAKLLEGYGCFAIRACKPRHQELVHRIVWFLFRGDISEGKEIHHKCGNRACVNPTHLDVLTPSEHRRGSLNGRAKLAEIDVKMIHRLRQLGLPIHAIAERFGVSQSHVESILRGVCWPYVAVPKAL